MAFLNDKEVGNRLKIKREETNLSTRAFAIRAGVDASQYAKIEKGELGMTQKIMKKLSEEYGLKQDYILYGISREHGSNVPHEKSESIAKEPDTPYGDKNTGSVTDQLMKAMIALMETQNLILKENKDVYLEKVNTVSIHIEAIKKNQDTLVIDLKGGLNDFSGKLEVIEKIVTEKFASLSQQMTDVGSKAFLHEFPKKDKSAPVRKGGKSDK